MRKMFLKGGAIFCSREETIISTILGSCVSVCVFDKKQKFGGMNHYLLHKGETTDNIDEENKYAETSIRNLLSIFKQTYKSRKEDLELKIIGGSSLLDNDDNDVGRKNITAAKEVLSGYGFKVSKMEVGGFKGRKVEFNTYTGEIRFKFIEKNENLIEKIKVLIIDDSKPVRMVLRKIFESSKDIEVIGEAADPFEAMELRKSIKPNVITLDVNMPKMDGVTYLTQYMKTDPVPTIIITDYNLSDSSPVFNALENGAFDYIKKPSLSEIQVIKEDIQNKVRSANRLKNFQRKVFLGKNNSFKLSEIYIGENELDHHLIALGASTGGTEAIKVFLQMLPANIPPIVIVQHIPPVFSKAFADRLNELCPFKVKEAENNENILYGTVYIAPGNTQMKVIQTPGGLRIKITDDQPVNRFKPSVDYLFNSVKEIKNRNLYGILLTGMGSDGAKGLYEIKSKGGETIAQDEASSVVFGMPKSSIELGAANYVLSLNNIAEKLCDLINKNYTLKMKKIG